MLVELLRDGALDQHIASRLFISLNTVKTHLKRIYIKTGCLTRTHLAIQSLRGDIQFDPALPDFILTQREAQATVSA